MKKQNMIHVIFGIIILLLLVTLLSYAYFSANIEGAETDTTISASGGTMNINYVGGSDINKSGMSPSNTPFADKEFTIKGNNTIGKPMHYNLSLIVKTNTFTDYGISYNLSLISKTGTGTTVSESEEDMCYILNGPQTEILGSGSFPGPTTGEETHTYNLKMYFLDKGEPQNEDQGKTINAYIKTEEEEKETSKCNQLPRPIGVAILADNGGAENITEAPTSLFDSVSTSDENKMYKMEDDYGDSYYFRGARDYVNNNLIFAEHQWKIIRINGDGSIRIIYNGECPENSCVINRTGSKTVITTSGYNNRSDNKYVGYMYSPLNSDTPSTSREQAVTNTYSSSVKGKLDGWYNNKIRGTDYEDYLSDTLFCNDREIDVGGYGNGLGYGVNNTGYMPRYRLSSNKIPTLKCNDQNDRFTTTNYDNILVPGNNILNYPVGLLTADEGVIAGLKYGFANSNLGNHLCNQVDYWTMSPFFFSNPQANVFAVTEYGRLDNVMTNNGAGVRAVLNLVSDIYITGTGTALDPYIAG